MTLLIIGCLLFFGVHSLSIVCPAVRRQTIARLGEKPWKLGYSVAAGIGLVLIIVGYGQARLTPATVYLPSEASRHITMLLMLPVFPLILASHMPGRIQRIVRHPMLWATALWAGAHLLANGTRADVVLFACFGVWALADLLSYNWRTARPIHQAPPRRSNDLIAVAGGLAIYAVFLLFLHRWLIGVPIVAF